MSNKLKDILEKVYEQGVKDCDYSDEPSMEVEEAFTAIISLLKEVVVPETRFSLAKHNQAQYCTQEDAGFNECRTETIKRIDSL
jgi:hypothetical protein